MGAADEVLSREAGKYKSDTGSAACSDCLQNSYNAQTAQTLASACQCSPGTCLVCLSYSVCMPCHALPLPCNALSCCVCALAAPRAFEEAGGPASLASRVTCVLRKKRSPYFSLQCPSNAQRYTNTSGLINLAGACSAGNCPVTGISENTYEGWSFSRLVDGSYSGLPGAGTKT